MFTGIVQAVGRVAGVVGGEGGGMRMQVETAALGLAGGVVGESVAVNGVCLTIAAASPRPGNHMIFKYSREICLSCSFFKPTRQAGLLISATCNIGERITVDSHLCFCCRILGSIVAFGNDSL